jgi:hypothetical protein
MSADTPLSSCESDDRRKALHATPFEHPIVAKEKVTLALTRLVMSLPRFIVRDANTGDVILRTTTFHKSLGSKGEGHLGAPKTWAMSATMTSASGAFVCKMFPVTMVFTISPGFVFRNDCKQLFLTRRTLSSASST